MRVLLLLTVSVMGPLVGCASLEDAPGSDGQPSTVAVACTNSQVPTVVAPFDWELTVNPEPIESGKPFAATLGGAVVLHEAILDAAQQVLPEGFQRMDLVDLKATVHVRDGASGADVPLIPDPTRYNYECFRGGSACNPLNDVEDADFPNDAPGLRANTDCEPLGRANPCGRFISVPTSTDCLPEGECVRLGKFEQCIVHEFCVTGDLRVDLQQESAEYRADERGPVLFGWDDVNTGAEEREGGPNDGTWDLPEADYYEPVGTIGLRMTIEGVPVAFDCTMGVNSQDPQHGVGSLDPLSSRTPDYLLISFPIE